jgi:hypothetical protein
MPLPLHPVYHRRSEGAGVKASGRYTDGLGLKEYFTSYPFIA